MSYDAIVIGAGHNGLVAAAYLARSGRRVLVLERRERAGGILDTVEIAPGVRAPGPALTVGRLRESVVRDLDLLRHGFEPLRPEACMTALHPQGAPLTFWADAARTGEELRSHEPRDGDSYPGYDRHVRSLAGFLAELNAVTPPRMDRARPGDLASGLRLGRAFRALGAGGGRELTRALPMAVADFVGEWFRSEPVRGALAARGTLFTSMGPWSAGTTWVLLNDAAEGSGGAAGEAVLARGGPGALAAALAAAARTAGVELHTGAEVARVLVVDDRVRGVVLSGGEEVEAPAVVSAVDPRTTLTRLLDPEVAGPRLLWRAGNIRANGGSARVDLALSELPSFRGVEDPRRLHGRVVVAPGIDELERAFDAHKYGEVSTRPYLEASIPTLLDPSLAPAGTHVMSVIAQWVPHGEGHADEVAERVIEVLEGLAPGFGGTVTARRVLTPLDLEREYGLPAGHVLHAEPGLDQAFAWRPVLGLARYRLAVRGLYLCGSGAHPGGGVTGGPGQNAAREILKDLG